MPGIHCALTCPNASEAVEEKRDVLPVVQGTGLLIDTFHLFHGVVASVQ